MTNTYDKEFWDKYANLNELRYDAEFAGRIVYTINEMNCTSILEVGCGTGIDLRLVPDSIITCGLDPNYNAVKSAKNTIPHIQGVMAMITCMPFADSAVDMIFTHRLLNYLPDDTMLCGMREMRRVAKKYIMSCEWSAQSETVIDDKRKLRNMSQRWTEIGARVIADVSIHAPPPPSPEMIPEDHIKTNVETRLTLVQI